MSSALGISDSVELTQVAKDIDEKAVAGAQADIWKQEEHIFASGSLPSGIPDVPALANKAKENPDNDDVVKPKHKKARVAKGEGGLEITS